MDMEDIFSQIEEMLEQHYDRGWSDGYESARQDFETLPNGVSFSDGVRAEQDRIQKLLQTMLDFAMDNNQMSAAKSWKNALDIVKPIDVDISDEEYRKSLEAEGF
jgi:hypothetical protein